VGEQRLGDIEFKIATRSGDIDRDVISQHARHDHEHGFALGGIDFSRHHRTSRFIFGNRDFTQTRARATGQPPDVIGNFRQTRRERLQRSMKKNDSFVRRERLEFITGRDKRHLRQVGNGFCNAHGIIGMRMQSRSDGGTSQGEFVKRRQRPFDHAVTEIQLGHPARDFLAQRDGRSVLQMGSSKFNNLEKRLRFGEERRAQRFDARKQGGPYFGRQGDVHRRGKRVIRALPEVDVVVGMNGLFGADSSAGHFDGAVGDDFVGIHVCLGTAAGLPNGKWKMVVEFALDDFVRGGHDEPTFFVGEQAQGMVRQGGGFFDESERFDETSGKAVIADGEMGERPLSLSAPITRRIDVDGTERIGFSACGHPRSVADGGGSAYLVFT